VSGATRLEEGAVVEVTLDRLAHGGSALGRLDDGRVCFVDFAIPGERVLARVTDVRRRWARAVTVDVVEPSPDRVTAPCPLFGPDRCGGCTLQHVAPARQAELLADVIADQLGRIGHLTVPGGGVEVLRPHVPTGLGYRTRARFVVDPGGHLAFRRARSHDPITVDDCPLLVAPAREALRSMASGWRDVAEVALHVGSDGSGVLAVDTSGPDPVIPSDLPVVGAGLEPAGPTAVHHDVARRRFVAGPRSFFQASDAAAELLVTIVQRRAAAGPGSHVVDCYAGVGLFSAALASDGARVTAIEASTDACADASRNTRDLAVEVVAADVAAAPDVTRPVDVVVLDPPRTGTGAAAAAWIAGLAAARIVYVSCDPATFARDARGLVDAGYELDDLVGVDQFTHTGHVELVGTFVRV
jgi:tRNA/tmRNA/rRNA uracil-C5-methylase (TrmA/RlmC/RlmD family)